jgi:exopolysaccharide biosynthesis polyprenyl glycosylphosphotransferase
MTTTGLPRFASAPVETLDLAKSARAVAAKPRRARLPWVMVGADVAAAASTALVGLVATPALSPIALVALVAAWPLAAALAGSYSPAAGRTPAIRAKTLLWATGLVALASWAAVAVVPGLGSGISTEVARSTLLLIALTGATSTLARLAAKQLLPLPPRRVVLVGASAAVQPMLSEARRAATRGNAQFRPVALCVPGNESLDIADIADAPRDLIIWRGAGDLLEMVRAHRADTVVVAPGGGIGHAELRRWGAALQDEGVELLISSGLRDVATSRLGLESLGGLRLLRVEPAPIGRATHLAKAAVDVVLAALLLVLIAPLLLLLAVLVRHESPGRALFTQTRIGRHGRHFTVYKLRTMRMDADTLVAELAEENESDRDGVLFKIKRDPRITRLGAVLRKYSLDELPQLINVVRGEMSLIGPRPALPSEVSAYSPDLLRRLEIKPGMTGLWQVSGRSDLPWEETVRLDLMYVDNWSWALDASIAVRTVGAVLGHRGAY